MALLVIQSIVLWRQTKWYLDTKKACQAAEKSAATIAEDQTRIAEDQARLRDATDRAIAFLTGDQNA